MRYTGDQAILATAGKTLVLPAVTIGNVGQLAIDLIVQTLRLPRLGQLWEDTLLPATGSAPFDHVGQSAEALELYGRADAKICVLQQRSMVASGRQKEFAAHMAAWIEEQGFGQVVMLCSVDAGVRHACELDNDVRQWCWQAVALAAADVPTLALGLYSSEGDNVSDAEVLADLADAVLGLGADARIPRWIPPRSWQRLFGPGGDMSAY